VAEAASAGSGAMRAMRGRDPERVRVRDPRVRFAITRPNPNAQSRAAYPPVSTLRSEIHIIF
jgi:hypothetical protein